MKISRELIQVTGFRFGGVNIGLKNESLDFGGIVANSPCAAAAVFTKNNFPGAPCLLYTSPSPRDQRGSRMPSSA